MYYFQSLIRLATDRFTFRKSKLNLVSGFAWNNKTNLILLVE